MPALNPVPKVIRVDFFSTLGSATRIRDRMFFQYAGAGPTPADLTTFLTTVQSAWATNMAGQFQTGFTLASLQATDLTSASAAQQVKTAGVAGTRAGTGNAVGFCAIVKFKLARRYRGGHPRMYLNAGVFADTGTTQTWAAAFTSGLAAAFLAFVNAAVTTPPTSMGVTGHVNVSYFQGFSNITFPSGRSKAVPRQRPTPLIDPVISYSVNPIYGSQRRRYGQSP